MARRIARFGPYILPVVIRRLAPVRRRGQAQSKSDGPICEGESTVAKHISKADRASRAANASFARYGLTVGKAQPARIGFGQSDGTYEPAVTGIRRPNVPCTESALTGRSVSVSVILPIRKA